MFLTIKDPKKRNQIINDFLKTRENIKQSFEEKKLEDKGFREDTEKLFKPITQSITDKNIASITETDKILQNQKAIYHKINEFPLPLGITAGPSHHPRLGEQTTPKTKIIRVSSLIKNYLSNNNPQERSNAGYSIRYNKENNIFTIGNKSINFNENILEIAGKKYNATAGLMELLTKKDPELELCREEDFEDYKEILEYSNAIYHNFNPETKRFNADKSEKWQLIRNQLFPELFSKKGGNLNGIKKEKNVTFLSSNPEQLIYDLQLSLASKAAGNNGEYNKINAILDELLRQKIISKSDFIKIYRNIFTVS